MLTDTLDIDAAAFAAGTGWEIKAQGACKGEVCVPLGEGDFDVRNAAERLGMSIVADVNRGRFAIGPASFGGRALVTAEAPDLTLHTLNGNEVRLSQFRGEKVVLVAWAPY